MRRHFCWRALGRRADGVRAGMATTSIIAHSCRAGGDGHRRPATRLRGRHRDDDLDQTSCRCALTAASTMVGGTLRPFLSIMLAGCARPSTRHVFFLASSTRVPVPTTAMSVVGYHRFGEAFLTVVFRLCRGAAHRASSCRLRPATHRRAGAYRHLFAVAGVNGMKPVAGAASHHQTATLRARA